MVVGALVVIGANHEVDVLPISSETCRGPDLEGCDLQRAKFRWIIFWVWTSSFTEMSGLTLYCFLEEFS